MLLTCAFFGLLAPCTALYCTEALSVLRCEQARAFYVSRYMLCALMLWELASMEAIHWSVLLHHVVTVFACCITTDEVWQQ